MAEQLSPIPTSRSQRWLLFRRQGVPILMFVVSVIVTTIIWRGWVAPPTFIVEAEAVQTEVRSAQAGWLANMRVELLQPVRAGDVIGHVVISDPKVLEASLAVVRAEIDYIQASMNPVLAQQRAALDYERLQLDWMRQRVELAATRGQLLQADADLARVTELHSKQLVTQQQFEAARNARNALTAQVQELNKLVDRLQPSLDNAKPPSLAGVDAALRAAINVQEERLKLTEAQLNPIVLKAPSSGFVSFVFRRSGEALAVGEPIVRITATEPERLVGFVRQPLPFEPKPGMQVELRTRSFERRRAMATITQVGASMEPISPSLLAALRLPLEPAELGLRVHLNKVPGLALRPGEQVDAIVRAD